MCPVVSHDWVNAEYKHLVVDASPKALAVKPGQFFNLLCPSPDAGELWLRRPQSVYRIDRAQGRIEFLYKCVGRGTYGLATLKHGDDLNMVGPLGVGFTVDPAWKHVVVLGRGVGLATLAPISQLAGEHGIGVTAILSARSPEFVMAGDLFAQGRRRRSACSTPTARARWRTSRRSSPRLIANGKADAFYTCGSNRLFQLMKRLGKAHGIPGPDRDGADHGLRARPLLRLRAHVRGRRQAGAAPGLHRRPGVRSAGGGRMVDMSVQIGSVTLENPIMPASGASRPSSRR